MSKIVRYDNLEQNNKEDFIGIFNNYGMNCVLCSRIYAKIDEMEFRQFLCEFGDIAYLWLEQSNGSDNRQALIFYSNQEGYKNAINRKQQRQIISQFVTIENCSEELKNFSKIHLILKQVHNSDDLGKYSYYFTKNDIINQIYNYLKNFNSSFKQSQYINANHSISKNAMLITKLICGIIIRLYSIFSNVNELFDSLQTPINILMLIQQIPIENISNLHIQALSLITQFASDEQNLRILKNYTLPFLKRLLSHTQSMIKQQTVDVLFNILNTSETRLEKRKTHSFHPEAEKCGLIKILSELFLSEKESMELKEKIALILGKFFRASKIELKLRKPFFTCLKQLFLESNPDELKSQILDILCGLAVEKFNIYDIASDNFVENSWILAEQSKEQQCNDRNLKEQQQYNSQNNDQESESDEEDESQIELIYQYSLELMLFMCENGGEKLENQIRNTIGDYSLLDLINSFNEQIDDQVFKQIKKWNNNEQLNIICKIIPIKQQIDKLEESGNKINFNNEKLTLISQSLLFIINDIKNQLVEQQLVSDISMKLLNITCTILSKIKSKLFNNNDLNSNQQIPILLIQILNILPLPQIQINLFTPLYKLRGYSLLECHKQMFNNGIVQMLIRLLKHDSIKLKQKASVLLFNIIFSGLRYQTSSSSRWISYPFQYNHPYYDILFTDGSIAAIEECLIEHQNLNLISLLLSQTLSYVCCNHEIKPSILEIIISQLKKNQLFDDEEYDQFETCYQIESLWYLATQPQNHNSILKQEVIQDLFYQIHKYFTDSQKDILQIFLIMFERGNSFVRQKMKEIVSDEGFRYLIKRKDLSHLFYNGGSINNVNHGYCTVEQYMLNKDAFTLKAWFTEEEKMNQIMTIKNEMIVESNEQIIQNKSSNIKDCINRMISIVKQIQDKELRQGAMGIVRDGINNYLFQLIQKLDENQIIIGILQIEEIIQEQDDELMFELINYQICESVQFLTKLQFKNRQSLHIIKQIFSLLVFLLERGIIISSFQDRNNFRQYENNSEIISVLIDVLDEKFIFNNLTESNIDIYEKLKLQAAIGFGCGFKFSITDENTSNVCLSILFYTLKSFSNRLQLSQQQESFLQIQKMDEINKDELKTIRQVLNALSGLLIEQNLQYNEIKRLEIAQIVQIFIHINCGCPFSIHIPNSSAVTSLTSAAYSAFSKIVFDLENWKINDLCFSHNIIRHATQIIISFANTLNHISPLNSTLNQINNNNQFENSNYYNLIRNVLKFIEIITNKSKICCQLIFNEPDFISCIMQILQDKDIYKVNKIESSLIKSCCFDIIYNIKKDNPHSVIEKKLHQFEEMSIMSCFMSSSGGECNDFDDVTSSCINNLTGSFAFLKRLNKYDEKIKAKIILNEIHDSIEEEGLFDQIDLFYFISDNRRNVGVKQRVIEIKEYI